MRILFTFVGGQGHFDPLVPIARAAEGAGHSVAFGCAPSMRSMVEAADFAAFALGTEASSPRERLSLRPADRERESRDLRERFARRAARYRAPLTMALCTEWKPDALVCDETNFGAVVAAERLGLPFATVLITASGSFVRADVVGEPLNELRAEHSLPPDPELEMLSRYLVLSPFPPSLRDPANPLPATAHPFRLWQPGSADDSAPPWRLGLPGKPTVYFTLGTIFNTESGDLLARVIIGLRELPVNLVVTVGRNIDPKELGPQPAHVHVAQFIPQASVLPHCDLVVSHGGSGSVLGALAHGLPSVLIPLGADQPLNAARCADLGVAEVLDAMQAMPERVRAAASMVLDNATYKQNAERLRDEIAALPEPTHAVGLLERLCGASGAGTAPDPLHRGGR
ncbi:MAG: glycosyltransferase family 1 protein [Deltaproteobacteria bacterium]|nr:glycosyltransferase family 1 protein [Deltaproteobacteria bacterium]